MTSPPEHVIELIFGHWRSQILYAGAELGVFDRLAENRTTAASALAPQVGADPALLYRLLRALAAIGLLAEDDSRGFRLTEAGSAAARGPSELAQGDGVAGRGARALCGLEASRAGIARRTTGKVSPRNSARRCSIMPALTRATVPSSTGR